MGARNAVPHVQENRASRRAVDEQLDGRAARFDVRVDAEAEVDDARANRVVERLIGPQQGAFDHFAHPVMLA